jgi:hypothetical protein
MIQAFGFSLIERGFAWAASSYATNGYDATEASRTPPAGYTTTIVPQLRTLFGAPFPTPLTPLGEK